MTDKPRPKLAMPMGLATALVRLAAYAGRELPEAITKPDVPRAPDWKPWGRP